MKRVAQSTALFCNRSVQQTASSESRIGVPVDIELRYHNITCSLPLIFLEGTLIRNLHVEALEC